MWLQNEPEIRKLRKYSSRIFLGKNCNQHSWKLRNCTETAGFHEIFFEIVSISNQKASTMVEVSLDNVIAKYRVPEELQDLKRTNESAVN